MKPGQVFAIAIIGLCLIVLIAAVVSATSGCMGWAQKAPEPVLAPGVPVRPQAPATQPAAQETASVTQPAELPGPVAAAVDTGLSAADTVLATIGSITGLGGLTLGVRKWLRAQREALSQRSAVDELVSQIDGLKDVMANCDPAGIVHAADVVLRNQSFETQKIVSKARLNLKNAVRDATPGRA